MVQILVVDDDSLLCMALANKLEYVNQDGNLGLSPVLTATTAHEAMDIIREKPVDILITDVQMPYQSGLELIEKVHVQYPRIQLVVLSGYSYYDYMRSAILVGVTDYLLKPVKLLQLKEIVQKCIENLHSLPGSEEEGKAQWQTIQDYRTGKYCNALLMGSPAPAVPEGLTEPAFFVALFSTACPDDRLAELLHRFCGNRVFKSRPIFRCFPDVNHIPVLLVNSQKDEDELHTNLELFCCFIQESGFSCRCGISCAGHSLAQFSNLHRQAERALSYQMIHNFTVKAAWEIPDKPERSAERLFQKTSRRILAAFQSRNYEQIYAILNQSFNPEEMATHNAGLGDIMDFYIGFSNEIRQLATSMQIDLGSAKNFTQFTNLDEVRGYFQEQIYLLQQQNQNETGKGRYLITRALSYMEQHYNQDIHMKDVAAAVNMSYTYFSTFFKEQTQQTFSECLTGIRMREAKRLMEEDPSIKIKEVANLVGYESVYSFSRAFKQYYKLSPTDLSSNAPRGKGSHQSN